MPHNSTVRIWSARAFTLQRFRFAKQSQTFKIDDVSAGADGLAEVQLSNKRQTHRVHVSALSHNISHHHSMFVLIDSQVKSGTLGPQKLDEAFIATPLHDSLLADLALSHIASDFCVVGPRVSGSVSSKGLVLLSPD